MSKYKNAFQWAAVMVALVVVYYIVYRHFPLHP